jgi:hypothetical protein
LTAIAIDAGECSADALTIGNIALSGRLEQST